MDSFLEQRRYMVKNQIQARQINNPDILSAFLSVPREEFVPDNMKQLAYTDSPLPILEGQTISQPYIVALMTKHLNLSSTDRVLEIGTGSGYGAAILSRLAAEVYTIERFPELAQQAERVFNKLGYHNIHVLCGDGSLGWPEHAPYNAISVTAGGPEAPSALLNQLTIKGSLVMPIGPMHGIQELALITKEGEENYSYTDLGSVKFVPLVGEQGWKNLQTVY